MSNPKYGSGKQQFIGKGIDVDLSKLDPSAYEGALAYSQGQIYYSNGSDWTIPQDVTDIARPRGIPPTNSTQQTQLRLSAFVSPSGETQTGIIFEWNADGVPDFSVGANIETRTITSATDNLYQTLYPEDGLVPDDVIWWRAKYLGTNDTQSEFSIPIAQIYPQLVDDPVAVTRDGAVSGSVEISPFTTAFDLQYVNTQVQFWNSTDNPEVDPPILEIDSVTGASTALPEALADGGTFLWRARYGANLTGTGTPTVLTEYTAVRQVTKGAASMVLVYDPALAINRTIYLPLYGTVNVVVDWGDGTSDSYTSAGTRSHVYAAGVAGQVTVVITGQLTTYGGASVNQTGLVRVNNIGFQMGLTSLSYAFANATSNLTFITPFFPPQVTNAYRMFYRADLVIVDISNLDVSYIENMSYMFQEAANVGDLSGWDTQSATTFKGMFYYYYYGVPLTGLTNWNTANVTDMSDMFFVDGRIAPLSLEFNEPIGNWNTSKVTTMARMFATYWGGTVFFNQDIGSWDVSKVTDFSYMFGRTTVRRGQDIVYFNNGGSPSINDWQINTTEPVNMQSMFGSPPNALSTTDTSFIRHDFNQPINNWDVSAVTNMNRMFQGNNGFNQSLADWDVSNADISQMFRLATAFNNDVSNWVPSDSIFEIFNAASSFNHPSIATWDVTNLTSLERVFTSASSFNQDISGWNVSNVTTMRNLFASCTVFNQPLDNWNVSNVTDMGSMFNSARDFDQPLSSWITSNVTDMSFMFSGAYKFNQNINNWNTSKVTNMRYMFNGAYPDIPSALFNQPLAAWDVSNVTDMTAMFASLYGHSFNQPLGAWDVSKVQYMDSMFYGYSNASRPSFFDQDLSGWQLRPEGVSMTNFFNIGDLFSNENYSRSITGWANNTVANNGPFNVIANFSSTRKYNDVDYFVGELYEDAVEARAYLTASDRLTVTGAGDPLGDGDYLFDGLALLYINANDWYFIKEGGVWLLKDNLDVTQATQQDVEDLSAPQLVITWDGDLSAATVSRTGAQWTITDGGQV